MKSWLTRLKRRISWYYLVNTWDFFILVELEEDNGQLFNTSVMVRDVLATMKAKGVCLGLSSISLWMSLSWQGLLCWPSLDMQGPPRKHIALLASHPNWPQNNVCGTSSFPWNKTVSQSMMHSCGIGGRVQQMMMASLLHLVWIHHCWRDSMAYYWRAMGLGYIIPTIPRLYWIYWWYTQQNT